MTEAELYLGLRQVSETDGAGLDDLARAIREHAGAGARAIVDAWVTQTGSRSTHAGVVARKLHELALREMFSHVEAASADHRVRLMTAILDGAMTLRALILDQVEPLIEDGTALEPPWSGRVRDMAYVLIRRMDGQPREAAADRMFLGATEADRDAEIAEWQRAQAAAKAAEMEF